MTIKSSLSGKGDDDTISIGCPRNYVLVSCGGSTFDASDREFDGTLISGSSKCIAINANGGAGVYARARCCAFKTNDVKCSYSESKDFASGGM